MTGFLDWSPDDKRIAFDYNDDTGTHIATISASGQDRRSITSAPGGAQEVPRRSPDGALITYDAFSFDQDPFEIAIWIMGSNGSSPDKSRQEPSTANLSGPRTAPGSPLLCGFKDL